MISSADLSTTDLLHFLRTFFNELFGRYANLQDFIAHTGREAGGRSPRLLDEYSARIQRTLHRLLQWSQLLVGLPKDVRREHLVSPFGFLIEASTTFLQLHRTLRWFSASWPEAELFWFLSRVFKENQLDVAFDNLDGSVVFSDEYNFITYDVGYVRGSSPRLDLAAWALPKSESANPLLWPVLVHEVAHSLFDEDMEKEIFRCIHGIWKGLKNSQQQNLLNQWAIELNADLFGFRLLGPAYLYSLIYFSIFFVRNNLRQPIIPSEREVSLHPPPETRVRLLLKESSPTGFRSGISYPYPGEPSETFYKLFSSRKELDNLRRDFETKEFEMYLLPDEIVDELWEVLKVFQQETLGAGRGVCDQDMTNISALAALLDEHLLAASITDPRNLEVRKYVEALSEGRSQSAEQGSNDLTGLTRESELPKLNEVPARMIDIVNAGWINKAHRLTAPGLAPGTRLELNPERQLIPGFEFAYPKEEAIASSTPDTVDLLVDLDSLVEPARQLQNSIQVALICSSLTGDD